MDLIKNIGCFINNLIIDFILDNEYNVKLAPVLILLTSFLIATIITYPYTIIVIVFMVADLLDDDDDNDSGTPLTNKENYSNI